MININSVHEILSGNFSFFEYIDEEQSENLSIVKIFLESCLKLTSTKEKKLSNTNFSRAIDKKEYANEYPSDIILKISRLLNYNTRLCSFPIVCHQFYDLSLPYLEEYHRLKELSTTIIEKLDREFMQTGPTFFALNFGQQNLSLYKVNFPDENINIESFRALVQKCFSSKSNFKYNVLNLANRVYSEMMKVSSDLDSAVSFFSISNENKPARIFYNSENTLMQKFNSLATFLAKIDETTVKRISEILADYAHEVRYKGTHDLAKLIRDVLKCFPKKDLKLILTSLRNLETETNASIDDLIDKCMNTSSTKIFKETHYPSLLKQLDCSSENILKYLSEIRIDLLNFWDVTRSYESSLFFVAKTGPAPFYSYEISPLKHNSLLADEHQWLSNRIVRETNKTFLKRFF